MKTRLNLLILVLFSTMFFLAACGQEAQPTEEIRATEVIDSVTATESAAGTEVLTITEAVEVPTAAVKSEELINTRCITCHGLSKITSKKATPEQWQSIVERMVSKGAVLSEEEKALLIEYLAANYK